VAVQEEDQGGIIDPNREDSVWHETGTYSSVVFLKERARDPTTLLLLCDMLPHKVPVEGSQGSQLLALASVSRISNSARAAVRVGEARNRGQH